MANHIILVSADCMAAAIEKFFSMAANLSWWPNQEQKTEVIWTTNKTPSGYYIVFNESSNDIEEDISSRFIGLLQCDNIQLIDQDNSEAPDVRIWETEDGLYYVDIVNSTEFFGEAFKSFKLAIFHADYIMNNWPKLQATGESAHKFTIYDNRKFEDEDDD